MTTAEIIYIDTLFSKINDKIILTQGKDKIAKLLNYARKLKIIKTSSLLDKISLFALINNSTVENGFKSIIEFKSNFLAKVSKMVFISRSFSELKELYLATGKIKISNLSETERQDINRFKESLINKITSLVFVENNYSAVGKTRLIFMRGLELGEIKEFYSFLLPHINEEMKTNINILINQTIKNIVVLIMRSNFLSNEIIYLDKPISKIPLKELVWTYYEIEHILQGTYSSIVTVSTEDLTKLEIFKKAIIKQAISRIDNGQSNSIDGKLIGEMSDAERISLSNFYS